MSDSQHLINAQKDLYNRRPSHEVKAISEFVFAARNAPPPDSEYDNEPTRSHVARLLQAGPVTLNTLDTSHPKVSQAVKMARLWADRKRSGVMDASLVLCGENGVGKTHIAQAIWWSMVTAVVDYDGEGNIANEYEKRPTGLFFLSNDLIGSLGISRDVETGISIPARPSKIIGYPPMIIIDDVGLEQAIPFVKGEQQEEERHARFFKVVNHCVGNVSVIMTSNKTWPELAAHIGRRAADRLIQMAPRLPDDNSFIVDLFGVPSYRRTAGGR